MMLPGMRNTRKPGYGADSLTSKFKKKHVGIICQRCWVFPHGPFKGKTLGLTVDPFDRRIFT